MRVLQAGGGPDFMLEALWPQSRGQIGVQNLERDLAVVLEVVCEIHRGHAAPA